MMAQVERMMSLRFAVVVSLCATHQHPYYLIKMHMFGDYETLAT